MASKYLVSSAGRSGCHLVTSLIRSCGKISQHTHDPFFLPSQFGDPDGKDSVIVLLERRDLFSAIMSMLLGKRTQQWGTYPETHIQQFAVDCDGVESEFAHQYSWHKNYIKSCTTLQYFSEVKHMYFEDIVADYDHVFRQLDISPVQPLNLSPKAPYSYLDIVQNVQECRKMFDWLEENHVFVPIQKAYDHNLPN